MNIKVGNDDKSLGIIVSGFVILLVGIVFLDVIADTIVGNTELSSITNESIAITTTLNTITNETITITGGSGATGNSSIRGVTSFGNVTNGTHLAIIRLGIEVNFTKNGTIQVAPNHFDGDGPYNVSYIYTTEAIGNLANDDVVGLSFFGNATNNTVLSSITLGANVNFTRPGVITVDTFPFDAGTYNTSYTYEGDLFVADTQSQALLKIVVLMFVLALIAVGIMLIQKTFPDMF